MNEAYSRLRKRMRWLNIRAHTWDDVHKILKRERINLKFYPMPDGQKGYYINELREKYRKKTIVINEKLAEFERLFVILHELVHHFLHITCKKRVIFNWHIAKLNDSQADREAETFSLILAIPKKELFEMAETPFEEINPLYAEKLKLRLTVYENFDKNLPKKKRKKNNS